MKQVDERTFHVLPINDLHDHDVTVHCWCQPAVERKSNGRIIIIIHRSADGRELIEEHGVN